MKDPVIQQAGKYYLLIGDFDTFSLVFLTTLYVCKDRGVYGQFLLLLNLSDNVSYALPMIYAGIEHNTSQSSFS